MDKLIAILSSLHPDVDFAHADGLIDRHILDSFDIITLVAEIDAEFGAAIPAEDLLPEHFNSVQALYALVQRLSDE